MKKCSKNSLKEWIRKIRTNQYRLPLLYEKLDYYNVKMIGYRSPSFEPRYGPSSYSPLSYIDFWLEKIWDVENEIKKLENEIKEFGSFVSKLHGIEKVIVEDLVNLISSKETIKQNNLKYSTYYYYIRKLNVAAKNFICKKLNNSS